MLASIVRARIVVVLRRVVIVDEVSFDFV